MPDKREDPCDGIDGPAREFCRAPDDGSGPPGGGPPAPEDGAGITQGASDHVMDLAKSLTRMLRGLLAPEKAWAPERADSWVYQQFLWLGQHLSVAIFTCVIVVCALTAWQGVPRLRQMGASTGWTLAAVAVMASVPGAVELLHKAVSAAFTAAFADGQATLLATIEADLKTTESWNPLPILLIVAALVVALAFAALVFMTRQLGILVFVCLAPVVLASLARGGDTTAVKLWAQRLLGLLFAPFALLLVTPFVSLAKGSLVLDAVLLVAADALMLRMIFHGVPYFGPKVAGAARAVVERNTDSRVVHAIVRAGSPDVYEQENSPRVPRTVDTPGRAVTQDRGVLLAAYGVKAPSRPGRLTTASYVDKARREEGDRQARAVQVQRVRRQARAAAHRLPPPPAPAPPQTPPDPAPPSNP
ncbi:hypothetical protein [Streptomyces roseolilacinus]|uniref:hypothetical protein n=1 Tax=Streptomyces roseolilacinus TaxID=66904 RepID=UPI003815C798